MSSLKNPVRAPRLSDGFVVLEQLDSRFLEPVLLSVNDPVVARLTATKEKFSRERIEGWLGTRTGAANRLDWAILVDGEYVGEIVLNDHDEAKNECNLRIALAGEQHFSKGYGSGALALVIDYALDVLKLAKVKLSVLEDNLRAINAYEKVGFLPGRSYSEGKLRFKRMSIDKFDRVKALAEYLMATHLDVQLWQFGWDNARRRAGLCNYTDKRITISTYLAQVHTIDETIQVVLHEIAHALCGKDIGHGKKWLETAISIGYRNERFTGKEIAEEFAPWVGTCPSGHEHYRYRKPSGISSCSICSPEFSRQFLISWQSR